MYCRIVTSPVSDAYLQDHQVRQFWSQSTARGRIAHLVAFFGRAARAGRDSTETADDAQSVARPSTAVPEKPDDLRLAESLLTSDLPSREIEL